MKNRTSFTDFLMAFFVITTCITIMEGWLGLLFLPDMHFGFEAFLVPPLFGFLSALTSVVTYSKKELSAAAMLFRIFLQLILIESIVFGINYLNGTIFAMNLTIALVLGIAVIFAIVYLVLWLNDRRIADTVNQHLRDFQGKYQNRNSC